MMRAGDRILREEVLLTVGVVCRVDASLIEECCGASTHVRDLFEIKTLGCLDSDERGEAGDAIAELLGGLVRLTKDSHLALDDRVFEESDGHGRWLSEWVNGMDG